MILTPDTPQVRYICNELFKCKSIQLGKGLLHVFNNILRNGNYPSQWMYSIITPIHKAGNGNDPQKYRGIAVSDNINKLFTKKKIRDYIYTWKNRTF